MIFSRSRRRKIAPVNFAKNREIRKSMIFPRRSMILLGLGMIFASGFYVANSPVFALDSVANFSVIVPEVNTLEITLSDSNLVLNLTPQMAEASFGSKDLTITVGTSSIAGYNLMMNTSNTALTSAAEDTIESLDEDEDGYICTDVSCNFTLNRWGFKKSAETTYNYVPSSVSLASNDAPTNGEDTTINFASRVDAQQPAGTYSTTLTFVATVNPNIPSCNPSATSIEEAVCLQDLKGDNGLTIANSMTSNEVYSLYDNRDYEQYDVAKLADGNVWFLDNLRLDPTVITLNSDNSNVTGTVVTTFVNKTENWTDTDSNSYTGAWYNLNSKDVELSYGSGVNKVGGYYNYCAASAGSYCYASGAGTDNAAQDLCPAGWRTPTGGVDGEYAVLAQAVTGTSGNLSGTDYTTLINAVHITLSGGFWNASAQNQVSSGYLWSSTFYNTSHMYDLYLDGSTVKPTNYGNRYYGYSIRCLLRAGTEMQGATTSTLSSKLKNVNDVATLVDTRDYQPYTVAKLADNKIWMTKNLNLPGGTEIESTKSDVPANYPLPTENGFQSGNKLPASSTSGFSSDTTAYVYNSNSTTCGSNSPCYSYYSWTAATAGSGLSITTENTSALYSICPRGWKLPSTRTGTDNTSDFRALMIAYGGSSSSTEYNVYTSPTGATMYGKIGPGTAPNFLIMGNYLDGALQDDGSRGLYWTSTSYNNAYSQNLYFDSANVNSANSSVRRRGFAARCLLAN